MGVEAACRPTCSIIRSIQIAEINDKSSDLIYLKVIQSQIISILNSPSVLRTFVHWRTCTTNSQRQRKTKILSQKTITSQARTLLLFLSFCPKMKQMPVQLNSEKVSQIKSDGKTKRKCNTIIFSWNFTQSIEFLYRFLPPNSNMDDLNSWIYNSKSCGNYISISMMLFGALDLKFAYIIQKNITWYCLFGLSGTHHTRACVGLKMPLAQVGLRSPPNGIPVEAHRMFYWFPICYKSDADRGRGWRRHLQTVRHIWATWAWI